MKESGLKFCDLVADLVVRDLEGFVKELDVEIARSVGIPEENLYNLPQTPVYYKSVKVVVGKEEE